MEGSSSNHFLKALLILFVVTSYIKSITASRHNIDGRTSTEYIRSSCAATTYPRLCFKSLSSHASVIQTDPKVLASTALSVTLAKARSTSATMVKLSKSHGLKPREVGAMQDCVEEISDSVDELQKSLGEMSKLKSSNFQIMMSDIQTWVSAALTDETTCTDGFAGKSMNGNVKEVVRGRIVKIAHLTSNALALINCYASLHG